MNRYWIDPGQSSLSSSPEIFRTLCTSKMLTWFAGNIQCYLHFALGTPHYLFQTSSIVCPKQMQVCIPFVCAPHLQYLPVSGFTNFPDTQDLVASILVIHKSSPGIRKILCSTGLEDSLQGYQPNRLERSPIHPPGTKDQVTRGSFFPDQHTGAMGDLVTHSMLHFFAARSSKLDSVRHWHSSGIHHTLGRNYESCDWKGSPSDSTWLEQHYSTVCHAPSRHKKLADQLPQSLHCSSEAPASSAL